MPLLECPLSMVTPSPDPAPDAAGHLIGLARAGDLDAFNALVELHQRPVYSLCLRMIGNSAAAEDATQEAFVSAYRNIGAFKGSNFRAWIMRIAANASIDEMRRRARRGAFSLDVPPPGSDEPLDPPAPDPGPEDLALRSEQRSRIQAALLRLPDDQRLAVVMCDIEGFAYEEIAETTRTSLGTVKSRIARGREKLRVLLAAERNK